MEATVAGIDDAAVTEWMRARVPTVAAPLRFDLIAGGRSNLTYTVTDSTGDRWVLRRPPLGHVLATAHDMAREQRIIAALAATAVPVPPLVGLCTDDTLIGAPFYVMDHVDGIIARDTPSGESLSVEARTEASRNLIEVLAAIHEVDVDAVGLGDLGRREAYVERQLSRWHKQYEATKDGDMPILDELHRRLAAGVPPQGPATIVHGDYRLDNCILTPAGDVAAVLDWELCTLGDPLADIGLMLVYWTQLDDEVTTGLPAAPTLPGFATRQELLDLYADRTGRDLSSIGYFVGLGYWKLACILQGVIVRYRAGAMGEEARGDDPFSPLLIALGEAGLAALSGRIGTTDV